MKEQQDSPDRWKEGPGPGKKEWEKVPSPDDPKRWKEDREKGDPGWKQPELPKREEPTDA